MSQCYCYVRLISLDSQAFVGTNMFILNVDIKCAHENVLGRHEF